MAKLAQLSVEDRTELLEFLIASLDEGEPDADYEEAWAAELQRRIDDLDSGRVQTIPAEEVLAELRRKYPRRPSQ